MIDALLDALRVRGEAEVICAPPRGGTDVSLCAHDRSQPAGLHRDGPPAELRASLAPSCDPHERGRDALLVAQIRNGDTHAFGLLFDQYFHTLRAFALSYVRVDATAEDVVQDVFVRIWENRAEWVVQTSVAQYLFGAVRNQALKALRRDEASARREATAGAIAGQLASEIGTANLEATELRHRLAHAIDLLPPRCREIFLLSRARRLRLREIADLLGIAVPTVKVQLGRALRALSQVQRDYENEGM
jgi:RNA polymerase sigma-70 factor (ECF subfamily)